MTNHPGNTEEYSLGSQSGPGSVTCISYESSLLSSLPRMCPYWRDGQLQWSVTACSPGTKRGILSRGCFHRLCVFQTTQRECARDQAKHRPVQWTGPLICVAVRKTSGGKGGQALPTMLLSEDRGGRYRFVATQF